MHPLQRYDGGGVAHSAGQPNHSSRFISGQGVHGIRWHVVGSVPCRLMLTHDAPNRGHIQPLGRAPLECVKLRAHDVPSFQRCGQSPDRLPIVALRPLYRVQFTVAAQGQTVYDKVRVRGAPLLHSTSRNPHVLPIRATMALSSPGRRLAPQGTSRCCTRTSGILLVGSRRTLSIPFYQWRE